MKDRIINMSGQTLIEAVVASAVVILLVTGLIAGTSASLKASQNARQRSMATQLTQESMEYVRNLRDQGWNNFYANYSNKDFCFGPYANPSLVEKTNPNQCDNNIDIQDGIIHYRYTRSIDFNWDGAGFMDVMVNVKWSEGSNPRESKAQTRLSNWR
jgi:type II secretory pathway pseudopilin PulG